MRIQESHFRHTVSSNSVVQPFIGSQGHSGSSRAAGRILVSIPSGIPWRWSVDPFFASSKW
jgi:hypothetical protein